MYERRWPVIAAAVVGILVVAAIGWVAGRSSAPEAAAEALSGGDAAAVEFQDGIPVGVENSRAGVLAAADNYVTTASETSVQDAARYERLVRAVYATDYQATALREAEEVRADAPELVDAYRNGRHGVAVVAARRLDSFASGRAHVTTWRAGVVWSSAEKPFSQWFLTETDLEWDGQKWRITRIDDARHPAPAPPVRYQDRAALRASTFERELRGMTAPIYGAAP